MHQSLWAPLRHHNPKNYEEECHSPARDDSEENASHDRANRGATKAEPGQEGHPLTGDIGMSTALADTHHVDLALEIPMRIGVILECYKSLGTII